MSLPCPIRGCDRVFGSTSNIGRHFSAHVVRDTTFACAFCPFQTVSYREFLAHYKTRHGPSGDDDDSPPKKAATAAGEDGSWLCVGCDVAFGCKEGLDSHACSSVRVLALPL